MKEIELINKRKLREKHFLLANGVCLAKVYDHDIHYLKNGKYEEINNSIYKTKDGYHVNNGEMHILFENKIIEVYKNNHFLSIDILNKSPKCSFNIIKNNKDTSKVNYKNIIDNADISYEISCTAVKESIILKNKNVKVSDIIFIVETDLNIIEKNGIIELVDGTDVVFSFTQPYIIDSKGVKINNIKYTFNSDREKYIFRFVFDEKTIIENKLKYPIVIDPTINNRNDADNVYDTYITSGEPNSNKNNSDILKVGIEKNNNIDVINRSLLKFKLPTIGTGSQIINAKMHLIGYGGLYDSYDTTMIDVHRITEDWSESTATWNNMYNKYDSRIDGWFEARRSWQVGNEIIYKQNYVDITELVKKWYESLPNYGLMLMLNEEIHNNNQLPAFYSKNNSIVGDNPKPFLEIYYRNDNGIENYYKYLRQGLSSAISYVNSYNGNLNVYFNLIETIGKRIPVTLGLVYNTNDVVLNNDYGLSKGYKFNYYQTLRHVIIDDIDYIEYIDEDGTIHYFVDFKETIDDEGNIITKSEINKYYDEDGLGYEIIESSMDYYLHDLDGNILKFSGSGGYKYLVEIKDREENTLKIEYDQDNRIINIVDDNNEIVNITYSSDFILINSNNYQGKIIYSNNKINRVESRYGAINITYSNELIQFLSDNGSRKIKYDYYEQKPYRIFKVTEFGMNDTEGGNIILNYNFSATTIVDNLGNTTTLTFNRNGNVISTAGLSEENSLINAYGIADYYGENFQYKNKLVSSGTPLKHVKNLISNSSFENNDTIFTADDNIILTFDSNNYYSGTKCLKINSTNANGVIYKEMVVPKGKNYTFSTFIKNTAPAKILLSYYVNNEEKIEESLLINASNDFYRENVTISYDANATSNLFIKIKLFDEGIAYIDNMQLEEGNIANNYNFIENSDFVDGISDWDFNASSYYDGESIPTNNIFKREEFNNNEYALKIMMNPRYQTSFNKRLNISGHAGDLFTISFWYKNKGLYVVDGSDMYNSVIIKFGYPENILEHCIMPSAPLNPNESEWQFFSESFVAEADYSYIDLSFFQILNANELLITNLFLYKDIREEGYKIDQYGNVVSSTELDGKENNYSYNSDNKLVKVSTQNGEALIYEYDESNSNLVLNNILEDGLSTEYYYNNDNNPIKSRIISRNISKDLNEIYLYSIRKKGTRKQLKLVGKKVKLSESNYTCNNWILEKITVVENVSHDVEDEFGNITSKIIEEPVDYYKIKHNIINGKYLSSVNDSLIFSNYDSNNSLFKLIKNSDGSYLIINKANKYLNVNNNNLLEFTGEEDSFYFETNSNTEFVESDAKYDSNSNVVNELIDNRMISTKYCYNNDKKPIMVSNPYQDFLYSYNSKKQLTKIEGKNSKVEYLYNKQDLLSKIKREDFDYDYEYDDFDNVSSIKIGDIVLLSSIFENNNGNLSSVTYGNGQTIQYSYDEHDRLITVQKGNELYNYYYDSNGNIAKIKTIDDTIQYKYDTAKKTNEYKFNDFLIKYYYNSSDNINEKKYKLGNNNSNILFRYNENENVSQLCIDDTILNITYDELGRIIKKSLSSNFEIKNNYLKNGKRNSYLIKKFEMFGRKYSFKYNKLNNITHIYIDNQLSFKYEYDEDNQLLSEKDIVNNICKRYEYDKYGNILYTKKYKLNSFEFIEKETYLYSLSNWKDLLIKYNDDNIVYDSIGNVIQIGNDKFFTWKNGNELASYVDNNNTVYYQYDIDGNRISKNSNGKEIKYYNDDENVIFEIRDNKTIYYLRDENAELIGFKYNGSIYYYEKDINGSVIGIYDLNHIKVASYNYDSWGKLIGVFDENNNDVSTNLDHIANINPYRYRSYYYDVETKLYYLGSRYYNPEWKRFISPDSLNSMDDSQDALSQFNLFVYCQNNPINNIDVNGEKPLPGWAKVVAGVALIGILAVTTAATGGTAGVIWGAALNGAIAGGASGAVYGAVSGGISNGWSGALDGACDGFVYGTIVGGFAGAGTAGVRVASGSVKVVTGKSIKPHGSKLHNLSINSRAANMVSSGKYSSVSKDVSLKRMGLKGSKRPDVIGIGKKGNNKIIEVVSKSQKIADIDKKTQTIAKTNKIQATKTISWVKKITNFIEGLFK